MLQILLLAIQLTTESCANVTAQTKVYATTMRQNRTTKNGGIDVLKVQQKPDSASAGRRKLSLRSALPVLNFADILARQGLYPDGPPKPCVMGYEVARVRRVVGENVDRSLIGKPVVAMTRFGGQSEKVVVQARQSFPSQSR